MGNAKYFRPEVDPSKVEALVSAAKYGDLTDLRILVAEEIPVNSFSVFFM
jgi:hypothetical protein